MGLSGSGKSTILRAVNRLNRVTRGSVLVSHAGQPVDVVRCADAVMRDIRTRTVATVFQQFALLPWRTVRENVCFGLELRGMGRPERNRIVDEKLEMVGLGQWADKHAHELSGGMQQRVGLARAFATDAPILLMDEPFSALDPLIRARLQDELLELQARLRKTIIFVSHDLDEAMKLGNAIVILEGGRIVQKGTAEQILLSPADEYVASFVRHMNPLNVLRGRALMTPVAALSRDGSGALMIDTGGRLRLELDAAARPSGVSIDGVASRLVVWQEDGSVAVAPSDVAAASAELGMRAVIALQRKTSHPILLIDGEGRVVGRCGHDEIYQGLMRKPASEQLPA
jgi:glycine betaine/proline transport system ATP-binding protein